MSKTAPTQCVTLWIGSRLGPVERACLLSVLRQGHMLALYCYRAPEGVPDGVEIRDARDVVPEERIIRHRATGSVSLFSNLFRYELQRRGLGTWLDCDAYLLKPLESAQPYLVGEFEPGWYNPGVLRLPPDSPVLPPLLALFDEDSVPPWVSWRQRLAARWRLHRTGRIGLEHMVWGVAGPRALTWQIRRFGLGRHAVRPEVLYPVRWQDADWVRDPSRPVESVIGPATVSIHLWNERIKAFKEEPAPDGSFLARLQREGAA